MTVVIKTLVDLGAVVTSNILYKKTVALFNTSHDEVMSIKSKVVKIPENRGTPHKQRDRAE